MNVESIRNQRNNFKCRCKVPVRIKVNVGSVGTVEVKCGTHPDRADTSIFSDFDEHTQLVFARIDESRKLSKEKCMFCSLL